MVKHLVLLLQVANQLLPAQSVPGVLVHHAELVTQLFHTLLCFSQLGTSVNSDWDPIADYTLIIGMPQPG